MVLSLWWQLQKEQFIVDMIQIGIVLVLAIIAAVLKYITKPLFRKDEK